MTDDLVRALRLRRLPDRVDTRVGVKAAMKFWPLLCTSEVSVGVAVIVAGGHRHAPLLGVVIVVGFPVIFSAVVSWLVSAMTDLTRG